MAPSTTMPPHSYHSDALSSFTTNPPHAAPGTSAAQTVSTLASPSNTIAATASSMQRRKLSASPTQLTSATTTSPSQP